MAKSVLYMANTAASAIAVGGTIPLGNIVRRYGCGANLSAAGVLLRKEGYYEISGNFTFVASATGTVTVTAYQDGVAIPGAEASVTAAAGARITLPMSTVARVLCNNPQSMIAFVLTGQAVTNVNTAVVVNKE